jgi:hypothetical protein
MRGLADENVFAMLVYDTKQSFDLYDLRGN